MPLRQGIAHQLIEPAAAFLLGDGDGPGQHEARRQRDAESVPLARLQFVQKEDLVVDPADAMFVAQRLAGLAGAVERGHAEQQPLFGEPVPQ